MPRPVDEWRERNIHRHTPDYDFGTMWTSGEDPNEWCRLSWNTGSHELHAVSARDGTIEVLGTYENPDAVAVALPDWGRHAQQPGGLDWVRARTILNPDLGRYTPPPTPDVTSVYGIVLPDDGTPPRHLHQPDDVERTKHQLHSDIYDDRIVALDDRNVALYIAGEDGNVNPAATALHRTGWPVRGPAILINLDGTPLPNDIIEAYPERDPHQAIEWDDHQHDRERGYDAHDNARDLDDDHDLQEWATEHERRGQSILDFQNAPGSWMWAGPDEHVWVKDGDCYLSPDDYDDMDLSS